MRTRFAFVLAWVTIGIVSIDGDRALAQEPQQPAEVVEPNADVSQDRRTAELDAETARIGATLRCPICRQQSVAESSAQISREMQGIIRSMLVDGKTPEEIEAYFVESYGPWILLKPKAEGANLLVYLGPLGAFVLGGLLLFARFRRTRRDGSAADVVLDPGQDSADDHVDKTDRDWLETALRGS